ncbi:hypothetical protein [Mycobacterium avium]|uniref:hypothetical protein n=1 Tax=Mycobacterium avium TaxID=1764 RepID=UPI001CDB1909|nr:hypothetical protein [Mycobacterium avium]MCA2338802.1 hypothetical protein [Mycobacterium avium]
MTATTATAHDALEQLSDGSPVLLGAALKGQQARVLFHYGEDVATVHSAGMRRTSSYARDSATATLYVSGKPSCAGITGIEVHATPEQADYGRRVLTLLLPYLPDESGSGGTWISNCARTFIDTLTARAEQHVWCVRASNGRILHASASEYSEYEFSEIQSWYDPEDLEEIGIYDGDAQDHLKVERVPEADIPDGITIDGARWAQ